MFLAEEIGNYRGGLLQVFVDIRDQLNYNWHSMSGWQYDSIFDVQWDFQSLENVSRDPRSKSLWSHYRRHIVHFEHRRNLNVYKVRTEVFYQGKNYKQILSLIEIGKMHLKKCSDRYPTVPSVLPIKQLICVLVKISTNPRPRIRILTLASS